MDLRIFSVNGIRKAYTGSLTGNIMHGARTMTVCVFLVLLFGVGTVSSTPAEVVSEEIIGYESLNSPEAVNVERTRDGVVGESNQAQIKAQACDSEDDACTQTSFAGLDMNFQMEASETLISINMTYESFGEVDPFGDEEDPSGYAMYVKIEHKFGSPPPLLIESSTTGYENLRVVELGDFAPYTNGTILFTVYLEHTDTNSFSDSVTARVHEIWIDKGPTDSDSDGVSDTSDSCPNTTIENRPDVGEDGCLETADDDGDGGADDADNDGGADDADNDGGTNDADNDGGTNDADGDGYEDGVDEFDNDETQHLDSDGDGYGDNASGNNPDLFPQDSTQWADADGDGYGDNLSGTNGDEFPQDSTQWTDTDDDGYGDNLAGNNPDLCKNSPAGIPNENGCVESEILDSDGDGIFDAYDECSKSEEGESVDSDGCRNEEDPWYVKYGVQMTLAGLSFIVTTTLAVMKYRRN
jgi:hypothetical protein